jgi:hypothetical protein
MVLPADRSFCVPPRRSNLYYLTFRFSLFVDDIFNSQFTKVGTMAQRSNFSLSQYSGIEMVSPAGSEEHSNLNMTVGDTLLAAAVLPN